MLVKLCHCCLKNPNLKVNLFHLQVRPFWHSHLLPLPVGLCQDVSKYVRRAHNYNAVHTCPSFWVSQKIFLRRFSAVALSWTHWGDTRASSLVLLWSPKFFERCPDKTSKTNSKENTTQGKAPAKTFRESAKSRSLGMCHVPRSDPLARTLIQYRCRILQCTPVKTKRPRHPTRTRDPQSLVDNLPSATQQCTLRSLSVTWCSYLSMIAHALTALTNPHSTNSDTLNMRLMWNGPLILSVSCSIFQLRAVLYVLTVSLVLSNWQILTLSSVSFTSVSIAAWSKTSPSSAFCPSRKATASQVRYRFGTVSIA